MRERMRFAGPIEKAQYLDGAARMERFQRGVVALAAHFAPMPLAQRAAAVHVWVRDNVRYRRDPNGFEELADCESILSRKPPRDDCDGKARLFCALALASGLDARILPVFPDPWTFAHVQAQVRYPGSANHPRANKDGWIGVELCLEGVPLGHGLEAARWENGRPVMR